MGDRRGEHRRVSVCVRAPALFSRVQKSSRRGFAVIELLNFLALAAVLSALGMYGLARYVRHAKTAEAVGSVNSIAASAANFYDTSDANQPVGTPTEALHAMRHFPPPSKAPVPEPESVRGKKYQSAPADWAASPWRELRFSIPQPQYYSYSFESDGAGIQAKATVTAHGDLDGDGKSSTFRATLTPDETFRARLPAELERVDPEE